MIIKNITSSSFYHLPNFILEDLYFFLPGCLPRAIKSSLCQPGEGDRYGNIFLRASELSSFKSLEVSSHVLTQKGCAVNYNMKGGNKSVSLTHL